MQNRPLRRTTRVALSLALLLWAGPASAQLVTDSLQLRNAIRDANAAPGSMHTITLGNDITLEHDLPVIASDITFVGSVILRGAADGATQDADRRQIFFVDNGGSVVIDGLTLRNGYSRGGDGGANRGGGGLGAGGAIFVNAGATVTLRGVTFEDNAARGGNGGADGVRTLGGGGGGYGGDGGNAGGGGGGFRGNGGNNGGGGGGFDGDGFTSGDTAPVNQAGNGGGMSILADDPAFDTDADGQGGAGVSGLGGTGGGPAPFEGGGFGATGGAGGRFGGGGGSSGNNGGAGGDFGGGGGSAGVGENFVDDGGLGGRGGFGGGGGGSANGTETNGGFGGGIGSITGPGGAGSSLGGAIFVRTGGMLIWDLTGGCTTDCTSGNGVQAASGSGTPVIDGRDLYIMAGNGLAPVGATIDVASGSPTLNGQIAGAGVLRKIGTGTLILGDVINTYSGGTQLAEGVLEGTTNSLQGDIISEANTTLVRFNQAANGTYAGVLSGLGGLDKQGTGEVRLSGVNTYTGRTLVQAGTLIVSARTDGSPVNDATIPPSSTVAVLNGATLRFDQNTNGTYSGNISSSTGTFEKTGGGALNLGSSYTFTTANVTSGLLAIPDGNALTASSDVNVTGGELNLAGPGSQVNGTLTLAAAARLTGLGTVGGAATISGLVSPGGPNTVGTLDFLSGLDLQPTAILEVDLEGTGVSDLVTVTGGPADLAGALQINPQPGFTIAGTYRLLTAPSVSGTLTVTDTCLFDYTPIPSATAFDLNVSPALMLTAAPCANTGNQQAVGGALEILATDPALQNTIAALNAPGNVVSEGLDLLSGEGHAGFRTARLAAATKFFDTLSTRMRDPGFEKESGPDYPLGLGGPLMPGLASNPSLGGPLGENLPGASSSFGTSGAFGGGGSPVLAASQNTASPFSFVSLRGESGVGGWLDGFASFASVDGDSNAAETDFNLYGTTAGIDWAFGEGALVGAAFGYTRSKLAVSDRATWGTGDTVQGAVYGAWATEWFYLGVVGRYAFTEMDIRRQVHFNTLISTADGDYEGTSASGYVEAGLAGFDVRGTLIQPMASLQYTYLDTEEFTEKGAPGVNLNINSDQVNSIVTNVGVRVSRAFSMDQDADIIPELRARWGHEFGDIDRPIDASFSDGPTVPFQVDAAEVGRDVGIVGVGWTVVGEGATSLSLDYDATVNEDLVGHTITLGLQIYW